MWHSLLQNFGICIRCLADICYCRDWVTRDLFGNGNGQFGTLALDPNKFKMQRGSSFIVINVASQNPDGKFTMTTASDVPASRFKGLYSCMAWIPVKRCSASLSYARELVYWMLEMGSTS